MNRKKKAVSLQTVADQLGISKYAVSLALNNRSGVSDETRKKVILACEELGYQKVKHNYDEHGTNILLLIPEYIQNDNYFYGHIYWVIENEIKNHGYNAIITSVSREMEKWKRVPPFISDMDIAGLVCVGVFSIEYMKVLLDTKIPIVSVDHYYDTLDLDSIVTTNEEGGYQATQFLIDNGHREIGFVGAIESTASIHDRWVGFQKAMRNNGLEIIPEFCQTSVFSMATLRPEPEELEAYVKGLGSFPTAWFCSGGLTAINMINILTRIGKHVPEDISIISFDNIDFDVLINALLTTYNVKRTLLGKTAVNRILEKIEDPLSCTMKICIPGNLIVRNSVRKLNS